MIIGNFHIEGMAITPHEADSPLVVDANRVLPFAITSQRFQMIAGRRSEDTQLGGSVELQQLAQSNALEGTEALAMPVVKKLLGFLRAEALNHTQSILRSTLYVKC